MQRTLKLVTIYDAGRNEYSVLRHNLSPRDADLAVRELSAKLFGLFLIDQHARHVDDDPELCEACQKEVERSSRIQPKPTFKRRSKQ
jgi:hypothetical protein